MRKDLVVVANVGDSRAVLCRGGRAVDLSTEHRVWGKTPGVMAEIERIESVGGWVDDGRVCGVLAVSRCARGAARRPRGWAGGPHERPAAYAALPSARRCVLPPLLPPPRPHGRRRAPPCRAFGDMEFKGQAGLKLLLQKGIDFELWDQKFADSRRAPPDAASPSVAWRTCIAPARCVACVLSVVRGCPPNQCRHFTGNPVTAQPDVTELALHDSDEFVVVASDGLWDVMDSQEVVKLARRDLQRGLEPQVRRGWGGGGDEQAGRASGGLVGAALRVGAPLPLLQEVASKLTTLAVKRGSQDNIGVVSLRGRGCLRPWPASWGLGTGPSHAGHRPHRHLPAPVHQHLPAPVHQHLPALAVRLCAHCRC